MVQIWDVARRRLVKKPAGHRYHMLSLAFSLDGQERASGNARGVIRRLNVATGAATHTVGEEGHRIPVVVSPDAT